MPRRSLKQTSFFDPQFVCPDCLVPGTAPWLLATRRSELMPAWLFEGWRGAKRGRKAWPADVLMTLVLLRWTEEGMPRVASVRRARTDAQWRAAMGLAMDTAVPSERTLRDFERFMQRRHPSADVARMQLFFEHVVRLFTAQEGRKQEPIWAADSTPMWCYGAVLDTVRLLGDGLRRLGKLWARATRTSVETVAGQWEAPVLVAKSTKGGLTTNWRDREARSTAVSELAETVMRSVRWISDHISAARPTLRKGALKLGRRLLRVIADDLEANEDGRLVIARRVTSDRLVSLIDPEARHGRKSKSKTFKGFKVHVLGDVVSGLIAAVAVTPGNVHDGQPALRLVRRARRLFDGINRLLGDTAYGGADLRHTLAAYGVTLIAPPPKGTTRSKTLPKAAFGIDFEQMTATCPQGARTDDWTTIINNGRPCTRFAWSKDDCGPCPLREQCTPRRGRRTLTLHPREQLLRQARADWERVETQVEYRDRTQCERLVNQLTRHGARQARAWGLASALFQVQAIATCCNLTLLAAEIANHGT